MILTKRGHCDNSCDENDVTRRTTRFVFRSTGRKLSMAANRFSLSLSLSLFLSLPLFRCKPQPSSTTAPTPPPLSIARAGLWYKGFRAFTWRNVNPHPSTCFGKVRWFISPLPPSRQSLSSSLFCSPVCLFIKLELIGPLA